MSQTQPLCILFADVSGSTKLFEQRGDVEARRIIAAVLDALTKVCNSHGGKVIKTIGDEIMCTFPGAMNGVIAATDMQKRVAHDMVFVRDNLGIRIGLHHGDTLVEDNDVYGDAVNTAARMASLAKREQIDDMFDAITADFGRLDVLVNNAALGALRPLDQLDERDWTRTFDTILKGSLWCSQRAAALMSSGGAIVNLSSIGAPMVLDGYTAIGTAKAALESLTRYLAIEYAPAGIRVNTVCPGQIESPMIDQLFADRAAAAGTTPEAERAAFVRRIPVGRLGTPDEVADAYVFLASPLSAYVTGQSLVVDGGWSVGPA